MSRLRQARGRSGRDHTDACRSFRLKLSGEARIYDDSSLAHKVNGLDLLAASSREKESIVDIDLQRQREVATRLKRLDGRAQQVCETAQRLLSSRAQRNPRRPRYASRRATCRNNGKQRRSGGRHVVQGLLEGASGLICADDVRREDGAALQ
jgi:hypothetical protein